MKDMKEPIKKYNKLVLTDEVKESINTMLEINKQIANEKLNQYVDFDAAMEDICSGEFYSITRDTMEELNSHIDFRNDNATIVFEKFADDRELLWKNIKENGYTM
jgi:hypothetical protein